VAASQGERAAPPTFSPAAVAPAEEESTDTPTQHDCAPGAEADGDVTAEALAPADAAVELENAPAEDDDFAAAEQLDDDEQGTAELEDEEAPAHDERASSGVTRGSDVSAQVPTGLADDAGIAAVGDDEGGDGAPAAADLDEYGANAEYEVDE
jgi:hypothetical protein